MVRLRAMFLLSIAGCLEPTEVKLQLSTDICGLKRVTIYFDGQPEAPIASFDPKGLCPRDLGTLVFVPSNRGDKFAVVVEATKAADGKCDPTQCVKAARTVSYVKHASLELPIQLDASCVGVSCMPGKTCAKGRCVDPEVACATIKRLCDVADDGGVGPDDSGVAACVSGASGKIVTGTALHHWTFDEFAGDYQDTIGTADATLGTGFTKMAVGGKCLGALGYSTNGMNLMPLGGAAATAGVGFVADLRVTGAGNGNFSIISAGRTLPAGWMISGVPGPNATYSLAVTVFSQTTASGLAGSKTPIASDGAWHHVEVLGWGSIVHFVVDTGLAESIQLSQGMIPTGPLPLDLTGAAEASVAIDNLWIYSGK